MIPTFGSLASGIYFEYYLIFKYYFKIPGEQKGNIWEWLSLGRKSRLSENWRVCSSFLLKVLALISQFVLL